MSVGVNARWLQGGPADGQGLSLSQATKFLFYFLSTVQLRRAGVEWLWWASCAQPQSIHHNSLYIFLLTCVRE